MTITTSPPTATWSAPGAWINSTIISTGTAAATWSPKSTQVIRTVSTTPPAATWAAVNATIEENQFSTISTSPPSATWAAVNADIGMVISTTPAEAGWHTWQWQATIVGSAPDTPPQRIINILAENRIIKL